MINCPYCNYKTRKTRVHKTYESERLWIHMTKFHTRKLDDEMRKLMDKGG